MRSFAAAQRPSPAAAAFDRIAGSYDALWTESPAGMLQRLSVWRVLLPLFQPGDAVLDLGCGTGVDACRLAASGVRVHAADAAANMLRLARRRAEREQAGALITFHQTCLEGLPTASFPSRFQGALSNFGALNCIEDLPALSDTLAHLLEPGAPLVLCVMGRFCAWETLWHAAHGDLRKAFRRLRAVPERARLAHGPEFPVYYRTVSGIAEAFEPGFDLRLAIGVGITVPPSCAATFVSRRPRLLRAAVAADRMVASWPVFRSLSDHRLLVFVRKEDEREPQAGRALRFRCPSCRKPAGVLQPAASCSGCGFVFEVKNGIVCGLPGPRRSCYERFASEYCAIRRAEGRGSEDPACYRALPHRDLTGRNVAQWAHRARTYRYFEKRLLPHFERGRSLDILDLGAGTGWFSYRMAKRGHRPVAVDLLADPLDGLGAARHLTPDLEQPFPCVQAEFDNLPLCDGQFDLAVFNASAHYSVDCRITFAEALRCLRRRGVLVVMDSPVYREAEHGERMREERHRFFQDTYGFRSDSVPSREYLDDGLLCDLERSLWIHWERHSPWYGWRWHLRPLGARIMRRRPPSRFQILVGRRPG